MTAVAWPDELRPSMLPNFRIENPSISGGLAVTGSEQVIASIAHRWRCTGTWLVRGNAAARAFLAFREAMDGRANTTLVPACAGRLANWPVDAQGRVLHPGFTRRKQLDGTAYEDPEIPAQSEIVATVTIDAAAGATSLSIGVSQGSALQAGQLFGLGERLYRIIRLTAVGSYQVASIRPRLREAATAGTVVLLTRPVCRMRFVSDDQGADLEYPPASVVPLEFVEDY